MPYFQSTYSIGYNDASDLGSVALVEYDDHRMVELFTTTHNDGGPYKAGVGPHTAAGIIGNAVSKLVPGLTYKDAVDWAERLAGSGIPEEVAKNGEKSIRMKTLPNNEYEFILTEPLS